MTSNEERAQVAQAALEARGLPGGEYGPDEITEAVTDLIADLLHLADTSGADARRVFLRAWEHFTAEARTT